MKIVKWLFIALLLVALAYIVQGLLVHPSLDREWTKDQAQLGTFKFVSEDTIEVYNVRDGKYRTKHDYDVEYLTKRYDLNELESAWFLVEPFGKFGVAHTLVTFGFTDGEYLAVSAEIRKEQGEAFGLVPGVWRQYELSYVLATEQDVVALRTNHRQDKVLLYPIKASKTKMRSVLVDMLQRANKLAEEPEFYNAISNNCTTNIIKHVRKFTDKVIPWYDFRYTLPATVDAVAYEAGIIDTDLTLDEAREHYYITSRAQQCDLASFSGCIREFK